MNANRPQIPNSPSNANAANTRQPNANASPSNANTSIFNSRNAPSNNSTNSNTRPQPVSAPQVVPAAVPAPLLLTTNKQKRTRKPSTDRGPNKKALIVEARAAGFCCVWKTKKADLLAALNKFKKTGKVPSEFKKRAKAGEACGTGNDCYSRNCVGKVCQRNGKGKSTKTRGSKKDRTPSPLPNAKMVTNKPRKPRVKRSSSASSLVSRSPKSRQEIFIVDRQKTQNEKGKKCVYKCVRQCE